MDKFKETGVVYFDADLRDQRVHAALSGRQYLQNLGNEARTVFGENFWVDQVLPREPLNDTSTLVISDVRYPNEAERIRALGGVVWEVVRPGVDSDGHVSEQPLPRELISYQINNNSSLAQLADHVEAALLSINNPF